MNALQFLNKITRGEGRIVSTGELSVFQINEFRASGNMFVDDATGMGWCVVPWDLTTAKDRGRETEYFKRNNTNAEQVQDRKFTGMPRNWGRPGSAD